MGAVTWQPLAGQVANATYGERIWAGCRCCWAAAGQQALQQPIGQDRPMQYLLLNPAKQDTL